MSYLGQVELKSSEIRRIDVTSSTSATHTLTWTPPSEQSLIITINGIKQQNNYSIAGTTLTLDTALVATDEMEVVGILDIGEATIPPDDSITTAMVKDDAITADKLAAGLANATHTGDVTGATALTIADDAVTADKLANSINTEIAANTAKVTNATHTGDVTGATALTIAAGAVDIPMLSATGTADATTFLRGDNAWASAGGDNTPSFYAYRSGTQSIANNTWTKLAIITELWDTDSAYDAASSYEFTVPAGEGGKYVFHAATGLNTSGSVETILGFNLTSSTGTQSTSQEGFASGVKYSTVTMVALLDAADVVSVQVYQNTGSSQNANSCVFAGFKLIGV